MAKNVLAIRVSDEKKAEWKARAEKAGMRLGPWIESMCDRPDWVEPSGDLRVENLEALFQKAHGPQITECRTDHVQGITEMVPRERKPVGKIAQALKKKGK